MAVLEPPKLATDLKVQDDLIVQDDLTVQDNLIVQEVTGETSRQHHGSEDGLMEAKLDVSWGGGGGGGGKKMDK